MPAFLSVIPEEFRQSIESFPAFFLGPLYIVWVALRGNYVNVDWLGLFPKLAVWRRVVACVGQPSVTLAHVCTPLKSNPILALDACLGNLFCLSYC